MKSNRIWDVSKSFSWLALGHHQWNFGDNFPTYLFKSCGGISLLFILSTLYLKMIHVIAFLFVCFKGDYSNLPINTSRAFIFYLLSHGSCYWKFSCCAEPYTCFTADVSSSVCVNSHFHTTPPFHSPYLFILFIYLFYSIFPTDQGAVRNTGKKINDVNVQNPLNQSWCKTASNVIKIMACSKL